MTQNTTVTPRPPTPDPRNLDTLARRAPATDDLLALAEWLAAHCPAHLSPIARIELAKRLITRRRFLVGAGALGLGIITGCGPDEEAAAPPATMEAIRTVTDVRGEVEIPANPQRVVTLDAQSFETAIDLGVPVIATVTIEGETWPHLGPNIINGKDTIGEIVNPNLEAIALVNPDLIIGAEVLYGTDGRNSIADELQAIAPTVIYAESPNLGGGWREYYLELADVYNQRVLAEERLQDYQQGVQAFQEAFGAERLDSFEVTFVDIRVESIFLRGIDQVLGGTVMRDVGLQRPENQQSGNMQPLSLEQLREIDADAIIVQAQDGAFEQIEQSPIWQSLNAVRNDQIFRIPGGGNHWVVGTLPAALAVLEDLFTFFVRDEQ